MSTDFSCGFLFSSDRPPTRGPTHAASKSSGGIIRATNPASLASNRASAPTAPAAPRTRPAAVISRPMTVVTWAESWNTR